MGDIVEVARKNGVSYKARVRRKGEELLTKTFKRKTDAQKWITSVESEIIKGRGLPKVYRRTVAEAIDRYLEEVLPNKKESTRSVQKQKLLYWRDRVGVRRLADIDQGELLSQRRYLLETRIHRKGQKKASSRGPAAANRYMAVLRHVFNVAMKEWEWCDSNPVAKLKDLKEPKGRHCILSDEDIGRILDGLNCQPREDFRLIVTIALTTGCRRGNAQSVRWEDIDFDKRTLTFPDTKNNEPLTVPITEELAKALRNRFNRMGGDSRFAFPSLPGSRVSYVDVKQQWRAFAKGLGFEDLHFHDLRHAVASYLAKNSVPLLTIGRMLGHQSLESTKRYAHIAVNDMVPHTELLGARLRRVK